MSQHPIYGDARPAFVYALLGLVLFLAGIGTGANL